MDIREIMITQEMSIKNAIKKLDETGKKILIITDDEKLIGVMTDGDIRRWLLKNGDLDEQVIHITNRNPHTLLVGQEQQAKKIFSKEKVDAMPIIDGKNRVIDIIFKDDIYFERKLKKDRVNSPVVIMAGGKGTRLYPYTKIIPKPLIPIGDTSILERIIEKFEVVGCQNFYITVNYKKNMIKAYMDEVEKSYSIKYVEEEQFLGTAGSLSFLKGQVTETFFVSNCDVLIDADYTDLLKYHKMQGNKITMVTSLKQFTIPYGIVQTNNEGTLIGIKEKPEYNFQVNTGLYILEVDVLEDIPENQYTDITDLMEQYISRGNKVGVYPITENAWLDMGEFSEMERMSRKLGIREEV